MNISSYSPDHAKRASSFQKEAEVLLGSNRNLITTEVFESASWTDDTLSGIAAMLPMSFLDQQDLSKMRDTNDRGSADETAIIIYTTAALHSVLDQVASQLDSLAKKWKSLEEKHNTHDDIHPDEAGTEDDAWVLGTAYVFRDLV